MDHLALGVFRHLVVRDARIEVSDIRLALHPAWHEDMVLIQAYGLRLVVQGQEWVVPVHEDHARETPKEVKTQAKLRLSGIRHNKAVTHLQLLIVAECQLDAQGTYYVKHFTEYPPGGHRNNGLLKAPLLDDAKRQV